MTFDPLAIDILTTKQTDNSVEHHQDSLNASSLPDTNDFDNLKDYKFKVYGMILSNDSTRNLSKVVESHWMDFHNLTGDKFLLITFQAPTEWNEHYKEYMQELLGDSFDQYWKQSQNEAFKGHQYEFLDKFKKEIKPSQMPCLAIFTNPEEEKPDVVIRSLPNWDEDNLFNFMSNILCTIREISNKKDISEDKRLNLLKDELTSPTVVLAGHYTYIKDKTIAYLKQHPAEVTKASASFLMAMGVGSSALVQTLLKAITGI